jgi:hypothetical protein
VRKFVFRALTTAALIEVSCLSIGATRPAPDLVSQARGTAVNSFSIAVLRRDGVVIPIVNYGMTGWTNRWPAPGRRPDIPISISDVPKGWWADKRPIAEWTAWPMGGRSRVVHVTSATNLTVECQPQVALQTDYQSALPRERSSIQPFPKDGLATAGDVRIDPVAVLDARSPEWAAVSAAIAAKVMASEPGLIREAQLRTPISDQLRASTPFTLEVLFGSPDMVPGGTVLYFEGVKRYPSQLTLPMGLITYAVGFARVGTQGVPEVELSTTLADTRREGLVYSLVLGSFHMGGRLLWVVQRSAWGYERFDIVEIRQNEVLTIYKTPGGVCE